MSELRANTISDAAGTGPAALTKQWAAKSVSHYNHNTPAVEFSSNVTSITDYATGKGIISFANNFNSATDFVVVTGGYENVSVNPAGHGNAVVSQPNQTPTSGTVAIGAQIPNGGSIDYNALWTAVFGDLV